MTEKRLEYPIVYAFKNKNDFERLLSQSGGAFASLSDVILEQNGIVYGCAFDDEFQAIHIRADNNENRNRMRYSKYVQSRIGETYKWVLKDLEEGHTVLFTGTSCQVAGVIQYVENSGNNTGKLLTVDIVCHGVPSPLVWKDYLSWESVKKKSKVKSIVCRNKILYGWKSHVTTIEFDNGKKVESRVFPNIFYGHMALRPSCYKCPYKDIIHPSDITIADYWGIENTHPEFRDDKGVSLVLINSKKGKKLFDQCANYNNVIQTTIDDCMQKPLIEPYTPPENREQFWRDYETMSFSDIAKKYGHDDYVSKFKWSIKKFLKKKGII